MSDLIYVVFFELCVNPSKFAHAEAPIGAHIYTNIKTYAYRHRDTHTHRHLMMIDITSGLQ